MDNKNRPTNLSRMNQDFFIAPVEKIPVNGIKSTKSSIRHSKKLLKRLKSHLGYGDQRLYSSRQFIEGSNKHEEFFCYNQDDEGEINQQRDINQRHQHQLSSSDDEFDSSTTTMEEDDEVSPQTSWLQNISLNTVDFLTQREIGNVRQPIKLLPRITNSEYYNSQSDFPIKHVLSNGILHEKPIKIEDLNKVFCSQWLSDRQVIFGTKCNKLMVLNVQTKHTTQIPSLHPSSRSLPPDQQCGIHSIQINPSKTLLATGGKNPNDLAVYKLPTLDPLCCGELAHQDWVFALAWLDDQFVVSGSRDTSLALWKIPDSDTIPTFNNYEDSFSKIGYKNTPQSYLDMNLQQMTLPSFSYINSVSVKQCKSAQKVRDLVFNKKLEEIAVVSLNGYIHIWSANHFFQKFSRKLPFPMENVCIGCHEDYGLYAVGSKSHTTLLDSRTIQCVKKIASKYSGYGIRSLNFYSSLLSIGTGQGTVMFYDMRAGKYLDSNLQRSATLKVSSGWTHSEDIDAIDMYRQKYTPAIYTHCIDNSGTRLFTAGGPLPITLYGNYIGLWH